VTCQEVDELAAAYALGALSQEQRAEVNAHLATCKEHALVLGGLRSAVGALTFSAETIRPPQHLKAQIIAAATGGRAVAAEAPRRRWTLRWPHIGTRPALGLLSLAVVALFAWNLTLQFSGGDNKDAFVRYVGNEQVHAHIYFVENVGVMTVEGLDPLPTTETYQAWSLAGGVSRSLGVLNVSDDGDGYVLLSSHVTNKQPVFLTIEPSGGSQQPSGATVLSTEH
jgi:anti-sigma-K factor RskA